MNSKVKKIGIETISLFNGKINDIYYPGENIFNKIKNCIKNGKCEIIFNAERNKYYFSNHEEFNGQDFYSNLQEVDSDHELLIKNFIEQCKRNEKCSEIFKNQDEKIWLSYSWI